MNLSDLPLYLLSTPTIPPTAPAPSESIQYTIRSGSRRTYPAQATRINSYPLLFAPHGHNRALIFLRTGRQHRTLFRIYRSPDQIIIGANPVPLDTLLPVLSAIQSFFFAFLGPIDPPTITLSHAGLHFSSSRLQFHFCDQSLVIPYTISPSNIPRIHPSQIFSTTDFTFDYRQIHHPDSAPTVNSDDPNPPTTPEYPTPDLSNTKHILLIPSDGNRYALPLPDADTEIQLVSRILAPGKPFAHTHTLRLHPPAAPTLVPRPLPPVPVAAAREVSV